MASDDSDHFPERSASGRSFREVDLRDAGRAGAGLLAIAGVSRVLTA